MNYSSEICGDRSDTDPLIILETQKNCTKKLYSIYSRRQKAITFMGKPKATTLFG